MAEQPQGDRYVIDPKGSRATIKGFATGLLSIVGHDPVISPRDITGEVRFTPERPDSGAVQVRIKTASLSVQNDVSDRDRREIERVMRDEVLETAKFPEIVCECARVTARSTSNGRYTVDVDGTLTLHGVARGLDVSAQVFVVGDSVRAQGDFIVRQTDFGIKPVSFAGGTLKLKDELKCSFDLVARKVT